MKTVKNKYLILIYRVVLVLLCFWGLITSVKYDGVWVIKDQIRYYTIISNLLILVFFIYLIIKMLRNFDNPFNLSIKIKGIVTMAITITFLVFALLISPILGETSQGAYDVASLSNILVHYIVPIMVVLDYIFMDDKGYIKKTDPLLWIVIPFVYFVICLISAASGYIFTYSNSKYPYDFIDIDKYGVGIVSRNVLLLVIVFLILGYIVYYLDNKLKIKKHKLSPKECMKVAYQESLKNANDDFKKGGPFGAVIVDNNGYLIAKAHNSVLFSKDSTAHAEVNCIRKASKVLGTHDLSGCILYTSCYPCPMCMSAIIWANIKEVYYGNTKKDADDIGFRDDVIYNFFDNKGKQVILKQMDRDITIKAFNKYKNNSKRGKY